MPQRPGQFRIDVQRQHAAAPSSTISLDVEAVEAHQPVGLVQPVLAHAAAAGAAAARGWRRGIGLNAE